MGAQNPFHPIAVRSRPAGCLAEGENGSPDQAGGIVLRASKRVKRSLTVFLSAETAPADAVYSAAGESE
jgi:hypothetical protein